MIKITLCFSMAPVTVQTGLRARKLALHSNRSYGFAFRSCACSRDPDEKSGLNITLTQSYNSLALTL